MSIYKTYFNWSSGKDSALTLYYLLQDKQFSVEYLLTSLNTHHNRVSMHGLRRVLMEQQVRSIGILHGMIELPEQPTNSQYEILVNQKVSELRADGFSHAAFGDIFLEDLRKYREGQLERLSINTVFPLWKQDTKELIGEFIGHGFKAITVCVNAQLLDQTFAGRLIDHDFINDLPKGVDSCGENGEFHTFCFDGPIFKQSIDFLVGETEFKEYNNESKKSGFWFCDLLPKSYVQA